MTARRIAQLVASCVVIGLGVTLLLDAALGSDGYSTLVNGLHLALDLPFWEVNLAVAAVFVVLAWVKGSAPGVVTVVQPFVVGVTVSAFTPLTPAPSSIGWRVVELIAALGVVALGVAGYLATHLGAGPTEAAALAWDPPLPFRWSYSALQLVGALIGWLLGAAIGVGTVLFIVLVGPAVERLTWHLFGTTTSQDPKLVALSTKQ